MFSVLAAAQSAVAAEPSAAAARVDSALPGLHSVIQCAQPDNAAGAWRCVDNIPKPARDQVGRHKSQGERVMVPSVNVSQVIIGSAGGHVVTA